MGSGGAERTIAAQIVNGHGPCRRRHAHDEHVRAKCRIDLNLR
jgi:hypothetical protein